MNRRKLFGILPLSLLGIPAALKAEAAPQTEMSPWVEHSCSCRIGADGLRKDKPYKMSSFWESAEEKAQREAKNAADVKEWERLSVCEQKYKHLIGVRALCPKCGGSNRSLLGDSNKKDIEGIPCLIRKVHRNG